MASSRQDEFLFPRSVTGTLIRALTESPAQPAPTLPEDLLVRWPTGPASDRDMASALFDDYCRRNHGSEEPSLIKGQRRLPEQRDSLLNHFRQHGVMRSLQLSGSVPA